MGTRVIHIQDRDPEDSRQVYIGRAGHRQGGFFGDPTGHALPRVRRRTPHPVPSNETSAVWYAMASTMTQP